MSPPRRHGPIFLVGTARRPGASLVPLASPVPLSSRAIAGFAAPGALSIPRLRQRRQPRLLPYPLQARCSAPSPGTRTCFSLVTGIGFAGHHFRLQLRLLVRPARMPVASALPSATAPVAPTVPVSAPVDDLTFRSGAPSGRVPLPFACRFQRLAHTPLGLLPFALPGSRIVRGVLLLSLSFLRPAAFSLTPHAPLVQCASCVRMPCPVPACHDIDRPHVVGSSVCPCHRRVTRLNLVVLKRYFQTMYSGAIRGRSRKFTKFHHEHTVCMPREYAKDW